MVSLLLVADNEGQTHTGTHTRMHAYMHIMRTTMGLDGETLKERESCFVLQSVNARECRVLDSIV